MKISIKPLDKLFSKYIRSRDSWRCRRCKTQYEHPTSGLHNMHCFTRGAKNTRFDTENCMAGCYGCHSYLDSHPEEKYKFWTKEIGAARFALLRLRAHTPGKIDTELIKIWIKKKLQELEYENTNS